MIVVGIDPGTQRTGYAVIEARGSVVEIRELGVWNLVQGSSERRALGERLELLAGELRGLLSRWNPWIIGLEKAVAFRNTASALTLSEARGVIRLCSHELLDRAEARIVELSPTSVKKEASGFGLAGKDGVRKGLALRFRNLASFDPEGRLSSDAFDALAIAWTAWTLRGRYRAPELRA